jgi:hypothetical protein
MIDMKPRLILFAVLFAVIGANAQSRSDVFNKDVPLTWLGIDFTEARFIGDRERLGSESDIHRLMNALNELMVKEFSKYTIDKATGRKKDKITIDISPASAHNDELEASRMISDKLTDRTRLSKSDIQEIISSYDFGNHSGIGLIFNVEAFSKLEERGAMWVTFVNLESKDVILTERMEGKPGGLNLRNFWAGSIHSVMEEMRTKAFKEWEKKNL